MKKSLNISPFWLAGGLALSLFCTLHHTASVFIDESSLQIPYPLNWIFALLVVISFEYGVLMAVLHGHHFVAKFFTAIIFALNLIYYFNDPELFQKETFEMALSIIGRIILAFSFAASVYTFSFLLNNSLKNLAAKKERQARKSRKYPRQKTLPKNENNEKQEPKPPNGTELNEIPQKVKGYRERDKVKKKIKYRANKLSELSPESDKALQLKREIENLEAYID